MTATEQDHYIPTRKCPYCGETMYRILATTQGDLYRCRSGKQGHTVTVKRENKPKGQTK